MRILFAANTPRDPNKGASGCDIATIEALRALGHEVDEIWAHDMPRRIGHANLHHLFELPSLYARAIAQRCQQKDYDVVQANQCHAYKAALAHRRRRRPGVFVNRSHGWEPAGRRALWTWGDPIDAQRPLWRRLATRMLTILLERHNEWVLRYSDGIVVCSEDDRQYVLRDHPLVRDRVLALAPGVPSEFLTQPTKPMDDVRCARLLHVGQFHAAKGPEVIAHVVRIVFGQCPAATFTWVCDKVHHDAARRLIGGPVANRVTMLDWMPRGELMKVYDRHGLFLFPSYTEGFSGVFLEAMARGLCVLASRINGMKQVIQDGQNGFLFERAQPGPMAERALTLLQCPCSISRLSHDARQTAGSYTWKRAAGQLVEFYSALQAMQPQT
jgi:glycosyltransferase involved in cell wall biosynthesis